MGADRAVEPLKGLVKRATRTEPGLILILIDESGSMALALKGVDAYSKQDAAFRSVNLALEMLVEACQPKGELADYYHVGVLGYGGTLVRLLLEGALEGRDRVGVVELAANPSGLYREDIAGDVIERPYWVRPVASGKTPMVAALQMAKEIVEDWCQDFRSSIAPMVLNVTDGAASDGDPVAAARDLCATGTEGERTLLFNIQITGKDLPTVEYPASAEALPADSENAHTLFEMSSELPGHMLARAERRGKVVTEGSRGFVLNGGLNELTAFLAIGTIDRGVIGG